jgi:phage-related protein
MGGAQQLAESPYRTDSVCVHEGRLGIVHGFIKKTQKIPSDEIELARNRMKEMAT